MPTEETNETQKTPTSAPPPPTSPSDLVRLRVDVPGDDYRTVRHIAIETDTSVNELVCEAVKLLKRYYAAQGLPGIDKTGSAR
jgi:hypothetical protein